MADSTLPPMTDSRKFKALLLAMATYSVPVVFTFILVLTKQAVFADLKGMSTWMGLALSPAFVAYIGGVALEGFAEKRGPSALAQSGTGPIVNQAPPTPAAPVVSVGS